MKTYSVWVHEHLVTEYIVEAESVEEARLKAKRGEYVDYNPGTLSERMGNHEDYEVDEWNKS